MSSKVGKAIAAVFADGQGTLAEWTQKVVPVAAELPKVAGPDGRALVRFLATADRYDVKDPEILASAVQLAASFGYEVTGPRRQNVDPELFVKKAIAGNVTEKDAAFLTIAARAGRSGKGMTETIAVLDSGFNTGHVGLRTKLWRNSDEIAGNGVDDDRDGAIDNVLGYDWVARDADPNTSESGFHASHVSGIATAGTDAVKVISMRVFSSAALDPQAVADAIDNAAANGARIMNMSFKVRDRKSVEIIMAAIKRHPNILFVKSAGNDSRDIESYQPHSYLPYNLIDNMAVVAAAHTNGTRARFSNYSGTYATHAMRGSKVHSTVDGDNYQAMSGTSMSSPDGSMSFAKLLILDPGLTPVQLKALTTDATEKMAHWDGVVASGGIVNKDVAYKIAGLTGLVRRGECDWETAAARLGIWGKNADVLIEWAKKYVPPS